MNTPIIPKIGRPSSSTASGGLTETKPKSTNDVNKTKKPCNCTRSQCLKLYVHCLMYLEFLTH